MALKAPRKTRKQKINRKTGFEDPVFEGCERWGGEKYHRYVQKFEYMYYNQSDHKDLLPSVFQWMKEKGDYTKEDISAAKKAKHLPPYLAIKCRLMMLGMPDFHEKQAVFWKELPGTVGELAPVTDWVRKKIDEAIVEGRAKKEEVAVEEKAKKNVYKPTIREVMFDSSVDKCQELDEWVDNFMRTEDVKSVKQFDPTKLLRKVEAKANHARIIRKFYEGEFSEYAALLNMPKASQLKKMTEAERDDWEQLKEGYANYSTAYIKAAHEVFKKILDACDIIIAEQKVARKPRKVKEKTVDQQVAKLKFKASDSNYGIASVPPGKLIGAVVAVVFNCKNRKLGVYISNDSDGFKVKGTSLLDYNEKTSVQKTIRKPLEVLPEYKKTTKAKTLKQFGYLKTTETKLNGRFNDETIILAVFK
jgi:hypothetical protein